MKQLLILLTLIIFSGCAVKSSAPKPSIQTIATEPSIQTIAAEPSIQTIAAEPYVAARYSVLLKNGRFVHNKKLYRIKKSKTIVSEGENILVQVIIRKRGKTIKKDANLYIEGDTAVFAFTNESYFPESNSISFTTNNNWEKEKNYFIVNKVLSNNDAIANMRISIKRL